MTNHVKVGGAWKAVDGLHVKVSAAWKEVQEGFVKVSGVWKSFYVNFAVSANKSTVSGSDSGFSSCGNPGTTDGVTVTAVGGTPPYTYAWAQSGGDADSGPYEAISPTGNATGFRDVNSSVCDSDIDSTEVWVCTVTDDDARELTVGVNVVLTWVDLN